jgi:hypothetical protein
MDLERLIANLKFALVVYLCFGGIPVSIVIALIKWRKSFTTKRWALLISGYLLFTKLFTWRHPLNVERKRGHNLMSYLINPLYRLNGGKSVHLSSNNPIDPNRSYLFVLAPHGIMPFNWMIPCTLESDRQPVALGARLIYKIPGLREIYSIYSVEGSPENFKAIIDSNNHAAVLPGGVGEMILTEPGRRIKVVCKNKGYMKLALQFGLPIVPIFALGENNQWIQKRAPAFISNFIMKLTGGTYPFFPWGSFGCILPNQTPVIHLFCEPLEIPKIDAPTREEIQFHHERVYKSMSDAIKEKREAVGFGEVIVDFIGLEKFNVPPIEDTEPRITLANKKDTSKL